MREFDLSGKLLWTKSAHHLDESTITFKNGLLRKAKRNQTFRLFSYSFVNLTVASWDRRATSQ